MNQLNGDTSLKILDRVISSFSNSCYNAAKANTANSNTHKKTKVCSGGIFDNIAHVYIRLNTMNAHDGWDNLRKESVEYITSDVSTTEHNNWCNVLRSNDTKDIWSKINWKGSFAASNQSDKPDLQDLAAQFDVKGQAGRDLTVLCDVVETNSVPTLDDDISLDEIEQAQKRLKEDKSAGDGWVKKMVTNLSCQFCYYFN